MTNSLLYFSASVRPVTLWHICRFFALRANLCFVDLFLLSSVNPVLKSTVAASQRGIR